MKKINKNVKFITDSDGIIQNIIGVVNPCNAAKSCTNKKCFWWLSRNYGFPVWWHKDIAEEQNKILKEVGIKDYEIFFPHKIKGITGTNCIEVICEDYKGKDEYTSTS